MAASLQPSVPGRLHRAWRSRGSPIILAMSSASRACCVGCGSAVTGRYCADCGEHTEPHDYSMTHLVTEVLETTAHLDGRVFTSFRSLLTRPGQLTGDFLAGKRKSQVGPVQMFVLCNVLYFL